MHYELTEKNIYLAWNVGNNRVRVYYHFSWKKLSYRTSYSTWWLFQWSFHWMHSMEKDVAKRETQYEDFSLRYLGSNIKFTFINKLANHFMS